MKRFLATGFLLCDAEGSSFFSAAFLEAGITECKYGQVDASRLENIYVDITISVEDICPHRVS